MAGNGRNEAEGMKALVVGLGKSGIAAAEALNRLGAEVSVYDGVHSEENAAWAEKNGFPAEFGDRPGLKEPLDMLVLSPGVPVDSGYVSEAAEKGVKITGELEMAWHLGKGKYIAITGTNGKTTTTTLAGEIFRNAGKKTEIVGNIGVAVMSKALDADDDTYMITECSSFQLETADTFCPEVSALLNVTPDHLNRHKTMENYTAAKAKIFANQKEDAYYVYNADDEICRKTAEECRAVTVPFSRKEELEFGAFVKDGMLVIADGSSLVSLCRTEELQIPGLHNLENALAAAAMAYFAGIPAEHITYTLKNFQGVEHRIERCGVKNGVAFVNDSKGTNPDAAVKAVISFRDIILIAGGYDKGSEYGEFVGSFDGRVKELVLMGATAEKIRAAAENAGFNNIHMVRDMKEAVETSYRLASPGDTVLLSPACASWDMYAKFEDRGDDFKQCVREL